MITMNSLSSVRVKQPNAWQRIAGGRLVTTGKPLLRRPNVPALQKRPSNSEGGKTTGPRVDRQPFLKLWN
jgi:hypothetical protein